MGFLLETRHQQSQRPEMPRLGAEDHGEEDPRREECELLSLSRWSLEAILQPAPLLGCGMSGNERAPVLHLQGQPVSSVERQHAKAGSSLGAFKPWEPNALNSIHVLRKHPTPSAPRWLKGVALMPLQTNPRNSSGAR